MVVPPAEQAHTGPGRQASACHTLPGMHTYLHARTRTHPYTRSHRARPCADSAYMQAHTRARGHAQLPPRRLGWARPLPSGTSGPLGELRTCDCLRPPSCSPGHWTPMLAICNSSLHLRPFSSHCQWSGRPSNPPSQ